MGHVHINDEKVISGEWINCSKGITHTDIAKAQSGENNSMYSGLSDDYLTKIVVQLSLEFNRILNFPQILQLCEEREIKFIKSFSKMRFDGKGKREMYKQVEETTGMIYNPYYKSLEHRKNLSKATKEYNDKN